jgi:hypothetical protein
LSYADIKEKSQRPVHAKVLRQEAFFLTCSGNRRGG